MFKNHRRVLDPQTAITVSLSPISTYTYFKLSIIFKMPIGLADIAAYCTPLSLRDYTQVFLNAFPIILGPYFAFLSSQYFVASGFLIAVFCGIVLVSPDNIQNNLENPYDGIGVDNIKFDLAKDYIRRV